MGGVSQGGEDRVEEKLAEVVYRVGNESCDAEVVGAGLGFRLR